MSLTSEWRERIEFWIAELKKQSVFSLTELPMEAFVTRKSLSPEDAATHPFHPLTPGTVWGKKWEYIWLRTTCVVRPEMAGKRLQIRFQCGGYGEGQVYINQTAKGSHHDLVRPGVLLSPAAVAGEKMVILAEFYAGHGEKICTVGPIADQAVSIPEPPLVQGEIKPALLEAWDEDAYQLQMDATCLLQIRDNLEPSSLRVAKIDQGLRDFAVIADPELPLEERRKSYRAARQVLQPLLQSPNGPTTPKMYGFGHGHLDVAWLWPLAETERKAVRTLSNQLSLIEEYPDYCFLHSQPHLFSMVRKHNPEVWQRVKAAVAAGKIIPEGGSWVEADMNISGGEALIRQFIHGKQFIREHFNYESELLWLPDVFGYSGAMPQIMRGCGIRYFATAKIFWNYHGGDTFPYNTFTWVGIDGSEILAHMMNDYNAVPDPASLINRWKKRVQMDDIEARLFPFGLGDGGGGPARDHLEFARRCYDLEGVPQFRFASPVDFFHDLEQQGPPKNRYVGELYFQAHRGVLTSQAKTKAGNRRSEFALRETEFLACAASALKQREIPAPALKNAWQQLLLNQFHDILPGSSITRVYREAEAGYKKIQQFSQEENQQAMQMLVKESPHAFTVFNSLGWDRTTLVFLPCQGTVIDANGQPLASQRENDGMLVELPLPACGWNTIHVTPHSPDTEQKPPAPTPGSDEPILENEFLRVRFNRFGEITSLYDKEMQRELAAGSCNRQLLFKDVPARHDAWDIDLPYEQTPVVLDQPAVMTFSAGPLRQCLRIERPLHQSTLTQNIFLRRGSHRLDFITRIDWQERHKLLKVSFPLNIHADEAVHEIQFGHLRRPTHRSRQFDLDRFEVCNHKWTALMEEGRGAAILNDTKYGVNVLDNDIRLSLLRAPLAPDKNADRGIQEFTYSFYFWNKPFVQSGLVQEGYALNTPESVINGDGGTRSLFQLSSPNIVIEAVKPAEDGSNDLILRLYESARTATQTILSSTLPVEKVEQVDMLENPGETLAFTTAGKIELDFRPFEIKTLRLQCGI